MSPSKDKPKPLKDLTAYEYRMLTPDYYLRTYKGAKLRTPDAIRMDITTKLRTCGLDLTCLEGTRA